MVEPSELIKLKRQLFWNLDPYPRPTDRQLPPCYITHPIEPDGPYYVALYKPQHDPIAQLEEQIVASLFESFQFLSGCRGSGKTTELNRLRRRLETRGYVVFHVDVLEYLDPSAPIEISELLIILAAAFSEKASTFLQRRDVAWNPAQQGYLERLWSYLNNTNVSFDEFNLKTGTPGFEAEFKATLRTTPTFREKIKNTLAARTTEIKSQVDTFIGDTINLIRRSVPATQGVVVLFDSLEQLRGSLTNEAEVMRSVEQLFTQSSKELLRLKDVHLVYTVPPWLRHRANVIDKTIPCVKLWEYQDKSTPGRTPCYDGWAAPRDLVTRRIGAANMPAVFGPPDQHGNFTGLDTLIWYSGGHLRDLLSMVRRALAASTTITLSEVEIENALTEMRSSYTIAQNEAEWLWRIYQTNKPNLPDNTAPAVSEFSRFLDLHLVMLFCNGDQWYDINPIYKDQVESLVKSSATPATA
jgi:hypothetical protein